MNKILANILKYLSRWVIQSNDPKIIAITGSVGKTSTKDAIYDVLFAFYGDMVWKTYGNLNTEIGVPMTLLKYKNTPMGITWLPAIFGAFFRALYFSWFKNYPKILVLEFGADKPGDIAYLTSLAEPEIAVVTEVGPAHLENFKNINNVAIEKMKLAKNLKADGIAILNQDNEYIKAEAKHLFHRIIWYHGKKMNSECEVARIVGVELKVPNKIIDEVLNCERKTKGRLSILDGINNSIIIDDTYNSNPLSVGRAFNKIRELKKKRKNIKRTIIVLGDMLELGDQSDKLHQKVANEAKKITKNVILVGNRFKGIDKSNWFQTPMDASHEIIKDIKDGDLILVKGSQGMRMEKIVEKIIKDRDNMEELLVRQSPEWKKKNFIQP